MTENPDKRIELAKELIESLRALIEKSRETRARKQKGMADTRETLGRSDMSGVIVTGAGSRLHLCQTCLNLLNKVSPGFLQYPADVGRVTNEKTGNLRRKKPCSKTASRMKP
jgi:hypothetical protein